MVYEKLFIQPGWEESYLSGMSSVEGWSEKKIFIRPELGNSNLFDLVREKLFVRPASEKLLIRPGW